MVQPYLSLYYETTKLIFDNKNQGYDHTIMVNNNKEEDANCNNNNNNNSNAKF
jgi:hypothetical protein